MEQTIPPAESSIVEFKREWTETVRETFCAFLNSHGGRVYFGVSDDASVVGIDKPDEISRTVHSIFKFAIHPSAESYVQTESLKIKDKNVVMVTVLEGSEPPYYVTVKDKNKKDRVCYIRQGSSSYEANDKEIRSLYHKGNPVPYEQKTSANQNLTFFTLAEYFKKANVIFDEGKYQTLGLKDLNGFFTNVGLWLSDQCTAETRVGFFLGNTKASESDGIYTFSGCIIEQFYKIRGLLRNRFGFVNKIEPYTLSSEGYRNEIADYPELAIREALINLFAHRDYSFENAQATVTSFSDRLEFLSFGGLPRGVTKEMMLLGISIPRNKTLADILMRLSAMERYGIGIPTIFASYENFSVKPTLVCAHEYIKLDLPRLQQIPFDLTERESSIVSYLKQNGASSRKQLQDFVKVSYGTTVNTLSSLEAKKIVAKQGAGRNTKYALTVNLR